MKYISFLFSVCLLVVSINAQKLATSPQTCFRDIECPFDKYCDVNRPDQTNECQKRLGEGARCEVPNNPCERGLYCGFTGANNFRYAMCLKPKQYNETCTPGLDRCDTFREFEYKCSLKKTPCGSDESSGMCHKCLYVGFYNDICNKNEDCQTNRGFYCKGAGFDNDGNERPGKCTLHTPHGDRCIVEPASFECSGFCEPFNPNGRRGRCQYGKSLGEKCSDDEQCAGRVQSILNGMEDSVFCNNPRGGKTGICADPVQLIKKLGVKCNPKKDFCDSARGLSCRWDGHSRMHVCMQRFRGNPLASPGFCTPNSKYSSCGPKTSQCRAFRYPSRYTSLKTLVGCYPRLEVVPRGGLCGHSEDVVCQTGTRCRNVPGVVYRGSPIPQQGPKFCVLIRKRGQTCGNKFRTACGAGLKCQSGKCVKGRDPVKKPTHAYLSEVCDSLPCVPGTVCSKQYTRCEFP